MRCFRIQRGSCLIAQKHIRFCCQRAGDRHTLLLAAGQLGRIAVGLVRKINKRQQFTGFGFSRLPINSAEPQGKRHVLQAGPLHQQVETLEDHGDLPAHSAQFLLFQRADILAVYQHRTFRGPLQHVDTAHQGTLARAAHAYDPVNIPVPDGQVDMTQRVHRPVRRLKLLGQILQLNHVKASVFPKYNLL